MSSQQWLFSDIYKNFNARDIDAVLSVMHPDVDWPNGMEGGRVHGHRGVREYWERQWKTIDPNVKTIRLAEDEAGRMVVDVHQVVRDLAGKILSDQMVQHVYSIEDDLIKRMDIRNPDVSPTSSE